MTELTFGGGVPRQSPVDWTAYADDYDLLLTYNPAYQDLVARFERFISACRKPAPKVLDVGGGTGNFSAVVLEARRKAELTFLEPDPGMMRKAQQKLGDAPRIQYAQSAFDEFTHSARYDLIVATHSLYTLPDPKAALAKLRSMAAPGAALFVIDFGGRMRVWSWRLYLTRVLLWRLGPIGALKLLSAGRGIAEQNRRVAAAQKAGRYWLHDRRTFTSAVEAAGWRVRNSETVYRGCSTLVLAKAD